MKSALLALLFVCAVSLATQLARSTSATAVSGTTKPALARSESKTDLKLSDISKFEWVDRGCRMWAADGDIDVDQTCLVIRTVRGGIVVIPTNITTYGQEKWRIQRRARTNGCRGSSPSEVARSWDDDRLVRYSRK